MKKENIGGMEAGNAAQGQEPGGGPQIWKGRGRHDIRNTGTGIKTKKGEKTVWKEKMGRRGIVPHWEGRQEQDPRNPPASLKADTSPEKRTQKKKKKAGPNREDDCVKKGGGLHKFRGRSQPQREPATESRA